jgi:hypothetical protein
MGPQGGPEAASMNERSEGSPAFGSHPKGRGDTVFRALAKEWVIYDPTTDLLHVLNATAALVWSVCDGSRSEDDIAREVFELLDDPPHLAAVLEDVRAVIEDFREKGLLE